MSVGIVPLKYSIGLNVVGSIIPLTNGISVSFAGSVSLSNVTTKYPLSNSLTANVPTISVPLGFVNLI